MQHQRCSEFMEVSVQHAISLATGCGHHREVRKRASSRESGGIMAYDASDEELIKNDRRERFRWSDGPVRRRGRRKSDSNGAGSDLDDSQK